MNRRQGRKRAGTSRCADVANAGQPVSNDEIGVWKGAYSLFSAVETGRWQEWWGPNDRKLLATRVTASALLSNLITKHEVPHLRSLIETWRVEFPSGADVDFTRLRESTRRVLGRSVVTEPATRHAGRHTAHEIVRNWNDQLLTEPQWSYLPSVIPGESPTPIDQVFVEVLAVDCDESNTSEMIENYAWSLRDRACAPGAAISVPVMAVRTLGQSIVVGEPGSGKSTLLHWLARHVAQGKCRDFDAALLIKLSAYTSALVKNRDLSLVEFFLESVAGGASSSQTATALRDEARITQRYMLLLDGWDEVPVGQRDLVLAKIRAEQPHFVMLITSRPSGLPRQLATAASAGFYRISGLTQTAIKEFIARQLSAIGQAERTEEIRKRIADQADWQEMTANPFLLGLLVRILARSGGQTVLPLTIAEIYDQITAWIHEQLELAGISTGQLVGEHYTGIQKLAYDLLFRHPSASYLFRRRELMERLPSVNDEPLLKSRFVYRVHPTFDEYVFLHATLQEYFAARYAQGVVGDAFCDWARRSFLSESRLIVLEFVAGMASANGMRLRELATQWLDSPDRSGQILRRVTRLMVAGRWNDERLRERVGNELWQEITKNPASLRGRSALAGYAALDLDGLARRIMDADITDVWMNISAAPALSRRLSKQVRLRDLQKRKETASDSHLDGSLPSGMMTVDSIRVVGAVQVFDTDDGLLELVRNPETTARIRTQAIECLCARRDRVSIDVLIDVVTGQVEATVDDGSLAAMALSNDENGAAILDPEGRDRLLRFLAISAPTHARFGLALRALFGHPLRYGSELLQELARTRSNSADVRLHALRGLRMTSDPDALRDLVSQIQEEDHPEIIRAMLDLAYQFTLPISMKWLRERIASQENRVELLFLLEYVVRMSVRESQDADTQEFAVWLHTTLAEVLRSPGLANEELAKSLTVALHDYRTSGEYVPGLIEAALAVLRSTTNTSRPPARDHLQKLLLAVAIIRFFRHAGAGQELRQALDAALARAPTEAIHPLWKSPAVSALAECIGTVNPGILLQYPRNCEPVQDILETKAWELGWLDFDDRILDSEGNILATKSHVPDYGEESVSEPITLSTPAAGIRLGAAPRNTLKLLELFSAIGREFAAGAASLSEVGRRIEESGAQVPYTKSALSTACRNIQAFFDEHDGMTGAIFHKQRVGLPISGLTERGFAVWNRTRLFLRTLGTTLD